MGCCSEKLCMPMGQRQPITIEKATDGTGFGNQVPTFSDWKKSRAVVEPLRGRELWRVQQTQAEVTHKLTLPYISGVTPKHRVDFRGRKFNISSVINIGERNKILELMCKEVV